MRSNLTLFIVLNLCLFHSKVSMAEGISVQSATMSVTGESVAIDADIQYQLSDEAREALEHGVPLYIVVEIKTEETGKLLWNRSLKRHSLVYRLEYHPLSQRYLLIDKTNAKRQDFQSLSSLLNQLSQVRAWSITLPDDINHQQNYRTQIRARLDIQSLPAPLRLIAFVSRNWQLFSEWQIVELNS